MITTIHIKDVKGVSGSFDIGKITNLIGGNGSGKSAILESVQVGLTGYSSLGKLPSKTYQLCSGKAMEITLETEDGQTLSRKFEKSGSGAKQTITLNGEEVKEKDLELPESFQFPVEAIHPSEFINLSLEKRADYIFSSLSAEINTISPEEIKQELDFFKQPASFSVTLDILKDKKSGLEKEVKRCLANIQKLTGEIGQAPAGSLAEWEEKKQKASEELSKLTGEIAANEERAKTANTRNDQIARLQKNITDSLSKIEATEKKIASAKENMVDVSLYADPARPSNQTLNVELAKVQEALTSAKTKKSQLDDKLEILTKKGCCPFCNSLLTEIEDSIDLWELEAANLQVTIETCQEQIAEIGEKIELNVKQNMAAESNKEIQLQIKVDSDALESYKRFYEQNAADLEALDNSSGETPVSLEILRGRVEGLKSQVKEADEAIKSFVSMKSIREQRTKSEQERMELEKTLENIKEAVASVKEIRNKRLAEAHELLIKPFSLVVQSAFGKDAFLSLIDNKDKPCFDFGLVDDDKEISFDTLSGGEKTIILAALVASIQKLKTGKVGIGLFELAEADAKSVKALLGAIEAIGYEQVVIASCHNRELESAINIDMEN